jgi:HK97 family phage portal protein
VDRRIAAAGRSIAAGLKAAGLTIMRFAGRAALWTSAHIPGTRINYSRVGDGRHNSIVEAVIGWVSRNFPEAPIVVRTLNDGEWSIVQGHPMATLIERPNEFFSGVLLWMATIVSLMAHGESFWAKVRNSTGNVIELWWVPNDLIAPKWPSDGSVFISHYEYRPSGSGAPIILRPQDVVHLRDGVDPQNLRRGRSRLAALLREVFTDDEATNYTAALLQNMGVPGVVIAPKDTGAVVDAEKVATTFHEKFSGDKRGEAMVLTGPTDVTLLSFNPQQMDLRNLRRIPEERISAVYGVAAIVAGLGAGLDRSTFANFEEARQAAYEECIIPYQRLIASELEVQLLPDFEANAAGLDVDFDLSDVRVLADDVDALWRRVDLAVSHGWITVESAKKMVGVPVDEGDNVYLRPLNVLTVPAGAGVPEQTTAPSLEAVKSAKARGLKAGRRLSRKPDLALRTRLERIVGDALRSDLESLFRRLADKALPTLKSAGRKADGLWDPDVIDWTAFGDDLRTALTRAYGRVGDEVYRRFASDSGIELAFDFSGAGSRKVLDVIGQKVVGIVETTRKELADAVEEARQRGYTVKQLRDGVVAGDFTGDRASETFTGLRDRMQSWIDVRIARRPDRSHGDREREQPDRHGGLPRQRARRARRGLRRHGRRRVRGR